MLFLFLARSIVRFIVLRSLQELQQEILNAMAASEGTLVNPVSGEACGPGKHAGPSVSSLADTVRQAARGATRRICTS